MMKRQCLTALLLAAVLLSSAGCGCEKPSENNLENILSEQYGDIFSEYVEDNTQAVENTFEEEHHDEESITEYTDEPVDIGPEISNYHVVDIGEFHNGLARVTVYIYDEGYWSSVAWAAGYNNGYFLYGYMDIEGNLPIKPIYNSAPEKIDGIALVEIYEGVNQSRTDIIDTNGNSMLPIIGDLNAAVSYGEITNGTIWVKTVKKTISGNINTITYYSEAGKMFSFENADIVRYYSNSDANSHSNFYDDTTLLNIDGISQLIDKEGNIITLTPVGFDEYINPYIGTPFEYYGVSVEEYKTDYWGDTYAKVRICHKIDSEYYTSKPLYGVIHWNEKTIDFFEYHGTFDYLDSMPPPEKEAKEYYALTFDFLTGAEVDIIDFSEYEVNGESFASLCVRNKDSEYFYCIYKATVFENDTIVAKEKFIIEPTQNIVLCNYNPHPYYTKKTGEYMYSFNDGLCLAKDVESGLYGYLNTAGQWAIQPQYQKAGEFSEGYATVNGNTIIDINGNIVLNTNN